MATIEIKDGKGKKAGTAELPASVFGIEPNVPVMHLAVPAPPPAGRLRARPGSRFFSISLKKHKRSFPHDG